MAILGKIVRPVINTTVSNTVTTPSSAPTTKPIQGPRGPRGLSAYEIWLTAGNQGSVTDFLDSLKASVDLSSVTFEDPLEYNEKTNTIRVLKEKITDGGNF
jgi:hypothetical protein